MFAVVGMDCVLPGAPDAAAWGALHRPAIGPVPPGRWPMAPASVHDRAAGAVDATTAVAGGFVDGFRLDPGDLDLGAVPVHALDPVFGLALHVVRGALAAAPVPRERTSLLLANLGLPSSGLVRAVAGPLRERLGSAGLNAPWLEPASPLHLQHQALPAHLVAAALGLGGGAAALDAACASGLYAVSLACDRLAAGEVDAVVAAGVQRSDSAYLFLGFSQLRALSPTGTPRPLDARADGLVVGEGAAAVLLVRLEDAVRHGWPVRAVIRGGGLGNDGRKGNMLAPDAAGQLRTLRRAWARADLSPATLGFVECHATGTQLGDRIEAEALHRLLSEAGHDGPPVALSSAKGLVGHTVTVAGLAGLLRAVHAVETATIPAGAEQPIAAVADSPHLTAHADATPWPEGPRRAAVSAFGFGGTDAHLIVEAWEGGPAPARSVARPRERLAVVGLGARVGELEHGQLLRALADGARVDGRIEAVAVDPRRWKIPPVELADLLPQQLLMLEVAADALEGLEVAPERTASIVGMEVDAHVADAVLRWAARDLDLALAEQVAPPLTSARVQGSLPNFVANRIAAQLDLQGPSYTVSAGACSGLVALDHAGRLLADDVADVVVVGAVDLPRHPGADLARAEAAVAEGAVAFVVVRPDFAAARGWPVLAELDPVRVDRGFAPEPPHRSTVGHGHAVDGLIAVLHALARGGGEVTVGDSCEARASVRARPVALDLPTRRGWDRVLVVPHDPLPPLAVPPFTGPWGGDTVPAPRPRRGPAAGVELAGPEGEIVPLRWPWGRRPAPTRPVPAPSAPVASPSTTSRRVAPRAVAEAAPVRQQTLAPAAQPAARPVAGDLLAAEIAGLASLADAMASSADGMARAHARFLAGQHAALEALGELGQILDRAARGERLPPAAPPAAPSPSAPPAAPSPAASSPPPAAPSSPAAPPSPPPAAPSTPASADLEPPRSFDRAALERHATGSLSSVFGPGWADLDRYEPRVRMPKGELLLCSRVVDLEGERGTFGPSRIVTEYDLPVGREWTVDGRPPCCVVVESGQADLFLVSFLGIDAECRGERIYRLLDCDLTFHGPRPQPGETLRHDIRIDSFARLGGTTLFYFHYDCVSTSDGRPVLSMRNGCAGFFTPAELARPKGLDVRPADLPPRPPVVPIVLGAPGSLDDDAVAHLRAGRASAALGPAFAGADGATLRLPDSARWCLVHRVTTLALEGGPHGLGEVVYEQDLRDDDWFNPIHFQGDPCMPGTLMFEGCQQAVQLWLLGLGVATRYPDAAFEPMPGRAARLRCRGQVAPGHRKLVYRARITDAGLHPTPWAVADVVLEVDGVPVVLAADVGVVVHGEAVDERPAVDEARVLEYSIGSAERAFGPAYAPYDGGALRCARMPGPPYLTMTRISSVDGPPLEQAADRSVVVEWEVADDAWYFRADPQGAMPFAVLLEAALQPCGWLTAWQGQAITRQGSGVGPGRYFRNLGGDAVQQAEIPPGTVLRTRATQTSISSSGGMTVVFFHSEVFAGATRVFSCDTHFGYFTEAALAAQKGLPLPTDEADRRAEVRQSAACEPVAPRGAPRDDWRMIDRIVAADPSGGAHGQGFYAAETDVRPDLWFFTAHFHQDPVMPGSLGLEALLQLARHALLERLGASGGRFRPLRLDHPVSWTYRGQVLRHVKTMGLELDVRSVEGRTIRADGLVRADGLPIYRFEDLALELVDEPPAAMPSPPAPVRAPGAAALLDRFTVDGDTGHGVLRLDPAVHPWLAAHCPTLTAPALPMAFAAEIAAEAATLLRPGLRVVEVPSLQAERWIHTGEGPVDLIVVAVAEGDTVAVTLSVHVHNRRYPDLSGPRVHMRAVVRLGEGWAPAEPAPAVDAPTADLDVADYYGGGHTFHGPVLQGMTALRRFGPSGAVATFATRPDGDLLASEQPSFVLDPLLLDTATHPMWSSEPERWVPGLEPGHLAYPVQAEAMRFFGPRPTGAVTCTLRPVAVDRRAMTFEVHLASEAGPWCAFRWTEAIVRAGPLLGRPAAERRRFLWDGEAVPEVRVGRPTDDGWEVRVDDLVEPLPGTTAGLYCPAPELRSRHHADDPVAWDLARLAAKEALRSWVADRARRHVHPRDLVLCAMRPDRYVVVEAPTLTAAEYVAHLGPTRFAVIVEGDGRRAVARIEPLAE